MKRMCMLFIALFVLAMAIPAMATETRVETMGDQNMFIQDDNNIWYWTSTVNNYPRHLVVDHNNLTGPGNSRVGMIVPFMKTAVIGAFFSDGRRSVTYAPMGADQRLDLFYGNRFSNFDLGVHVDWWGDKTEQTGTQSTAAMGVQAGLGFNANGNMFELDFMFRNLDFTWENLDGTAPVPWVRDAGNELGAAARYLWAYNNMVTLIPALAVMQTTMEATPAGATTSNETKSTMFDIGLGCNTMPLQGTEFLSSLGVRSTKWEVTTAGNPTTDNNTTVVPYIAFGADIQVKNWLNFRVGAEKDIVSTTEVKLPAPATKSTSSGFDYKIGCGVMLGDVQFDCEVANDWLTAGPYLLSGEESSSSDMFTKISFKYDFR